MFVDANNAFAEPFAELLEQLRAACVLPADGWSADRLGQGIRNLRAIVDAAEMACSQPGSTAAPGSSASLNSDGCQVS